MSNYIEFNDGEIVKCVDDNGCLTLGKDYVVIKSYISNLGGYWVTAIDDFGKKEEFFAERFIKISAFRNDIIDGILE